MKKGKSSFGLILLLIIGIAAFRSCGNDSKNNSTTTRSSTTINSEMKTETLSSNISKQPTATPKPTAVPTPTIAPTEVPSLQNGSTGEAVETLQDLLIHYGYLTGQPTKKYDNATVKAVKDFQINNRLQETGKFTQKEWETINSRYVVSQATVYKSKSGKVYHSYSTCSGMKTATEMTLSDALRKGLSPCSHCH